MLEIGMLVVSCTGRDAEAVFAVIGKTDTHLVLADGRKRRIEKPKHKKEKHVKVLGKSLAKDSRALLESGKLTNKMLYRSIKESLNETV